MVREVRTSIPQTLMLYTPPSAHPADMMQLDDASPVCSGSNGSPRVAALMSSASKLRGGAGPRTPLGELSVERGVDSRLPTAQSPAAQSPVAPISGGQVSNDHDPAFDLSMPSIACPHGLHQKANDHDMVTASSTQHRR